MEPTSRPAVDKETEPCHDIESKRPRLALVHKENGAKDDCDVRLQYKHSLMQRASKFEPGKSTALHDWIRDTTQDVDGPNKDRAAASRLLTAADLADVVAVAPAMTRIRTEAGFIPIHYALVLHAEEWVVEYLLSFYPRADLLLKSRGQTLLHQVAARHCSFEVFKMILDAVGEHAPKLTRMCCTHYYASISAFHLLCSTERRADDRTLHLLIDTMVVSRDSEKKHPLSVIGASGRTPLHVAARVGAGVSVLKKLVTLYPGALQMETWNLNTRIPLLEAADSFPDTQNLENVRFLMNAWPEGVQYKDGEGRTLIHRPLPDDILDEALKLWPDGIKCRDLLTRRGVLQMNPHHTRFVLSRLPRDSLSTFVGTMPLHKSPDVLHTTWPSVLHTRLNEKRALETIVALVEACPGVLRVRDNHGQTPLHFRKIEYAKPDGITLLMLRQYPCALYHPVKQVWYYFGGQFSRSIRESSIVGVFFPRVGDPVLPTANLVALLRHTLVNGDQVPLLHIVASHSAGDHDAYAKTVAFVHKLNPNAIRQEVSDTVPHGGKGRQPLHVACAQPDCRADNLQLLLDLYKPALNMADTEGCYPFMIAATNESASAECVYRLLRQGPDVLFNQV